MNHFEQIYRAYFSDVFRYARSLTLDEQAAEELTAETFFRAMRSLSAFRGECEIRVWLCRIAKNLYFSQQKRQRRFDPLDELPEQADSRDLEGDLADRQTALAVHRILHDLNDPYKEVFSLRVFGELSFREIGGLFDKSEHWACVTFHRAKEKIQQALTAQAKGDETL